MGTSYVFVLCHYDTNSIHAEPIPNCTAKQHAKVFTTIYNKLSKGGFPPTFHVLDNECSQMIRDHLASLQITVQMTPVGSHRRNAAERAIQTFKNHLIAGLCTTDPQFPLHLWDRLLPQCVLTLNLLRGSRINPAHSAYQYSQLHGRFDYNATPLAPPGIHVVIYETPTKRGTWDPHGKDGWCIGPILDAYRCYNTCMWDANRERKAETLTWFPKHPEVPIAKPIDIAIAGVVDIAEALHQPLDASKPTLPLTNTEASHLKT